ncbi:hypothetical protein V1477_006556 [Vespula maculifrons]|uniref:Uncharacterized protein n=3 Tax=Vespula TaxID=7451 RepID=A0A834NHF1_VESGE|nr:hypothetical protein HZH68_003823 [Vespula germanica]KAF7431335.1 hypothetical protein H0235_004259 [Vespula pensylvanica]
MKQLLFQQNRCYVCTLKSRSATSASLKSQATVIDPRFLIREIEIARYNVANVLWEQQGATCRKAKATSSISRNNVTGHIESRFNDAVSRYSEWIQIDRICELEFRIE